MFRWSTCPEQRMLLHMQCYALSRAAICSIAFAPAVIHTLDNTAHSNAQAKDCTAITLYNGLDKKVSRVVHVVGNILNRFLP